MSWNHATDYELPSYSTYAGGKGTGLFEKTYDLGAHPNPGMQTACARADAVPGLWQLLGALMPRMLSRASCESVQYVAHSLSLDTYIILSQSPVSPGASVSPCLGPGFAFQASPQKRSFWSVQPS